MSNAVELVAALRRLNSYRRNVSDLANAVVRENEVLRAQLVRVKADAQFAHEDKLGWNDAWGEHPAHSRQEWRQEVGSEATQRGYWEWVAAKLEEATHG